MYADAMKMCIRDSYCHIVQNLALLYGIEMPEAELMIKAEAHAIRNGGRSPRAVSYTHLDVYKRQAIPCKMLYTKSLETTSCMAF